MDLVIAGHGYHMHARSIDDETTGRNDERGVLLRESEFDLRIHSRQQRTIAVIDLDLGQHRACCTVKRVGAANHGSAVLAAKTLLDLERGPLPVANANSLRLGYINLDAQRSTLCDREERFACRRAAGVDQVTALNVPLGDDAIEWRNDAFEALHLL